MRPPRIDELQRARANITTVPVRPVCLNMCNRSAVEFYFCVPLLPTLHSQFREANIFDDKHKYRFIAAEPIFNLLRRLEHMRDAFPKSIEDMEDIEWISPITQKTYTITKKDVEKHAAEAPEADCDGAWSELFTCGRDLYTSLAHYDQIQFSRPLKSEYPETVLANAKVCADQCVAGIERLCRLYAT